MEILSILSSVGGEDIANASDDDDTGVTKPIRRLVRVRDGRWEMERWNWRWSSVQRVRQFGATDDRVERKGVRVIARNLASSI